MAFSKMLQKSKKKEFGITIKASIRKSKDISKLEATIRTSIKNYNGDN